MADVICLYLFCREHYAHLYGPATLIEDKQTVCFTYYTLVIGASSILSFTYMRYLLACLAQCSVSSVCFLVSADTLLTLKEMTQNRFTLLLRSCN
jgi:hypothetical protein